MLVKRFDDANCWADPGGDVGRGGMDGNPNLEPKPGRGDPPCHVGRDVATFGQLPRREPRPGRDSRLDPIRSEGAPSVAVAIPGEEVPLAAPGEEPMRL